MGEEQAVEVRQLVVERQGPGRWACWDSATKEWTTIGKEQETIRHARGIAQAHDGPALLRVVGKERKVKYERTYGGAKGSGRAKRSATVDVPPPEPGTEDVVADGGFVSADDGTELPFPIPEPTPVGSDVVPFGNEASALAEHPGGPCSRDASGTLMSGTLMLMTRGDGRLGAIDPAAVTAVFSADDGVSTIVLTGGMSVPMHGDFWDVLARVNAAREAR